LFSLKFPLYRSFSEERAVGRNLAKFLNRQKPFSYHQKIRNNKKFLICVALVFAAFDFINSFAPRNTPVFWRPTAAFGESGKIIRAGNAVWIIGAGGLLLRSPGKIRAGIKIGDAAVTADPIFGYVGTSGNAVAS